MFVRDAIPLIVEASADLLVHSGHERAADLASQFQNLGLRSVKPPEVLQPIAFLPFASQKCEFPPLARVLIECGHQLPWTAGDYELPPSIAGKNMFVELVGPEGPLVSEQITCGLYLQSPNSFYPPHNHSAEEFYYLLSGSAEWQKDDGKFSFLSAPKLVHHEPWQRHAMRTGEDPLLAFWVWFGDIRESTFTVDPA